ncbi:hypothetical protein HMPREF1043_0760 [Streptococcus anginosus subsp. whileyi CCUG 39159]|uniref:Uncharacterized protein n=1 Tax=Streptococcus anginosus subsp. whileyi CCUG 39159 TaxID=1095729 RepID=I0SEW5_STRAP|nr:hypothetical protein SanJ4211_0827c [Streptococcus anginosus]EID21918.1 hypothetical protein HMPREF1043_0760 [Streptococcus anginosus subsp. whileyi CCUG 39159]
MDSSPFYRLFAIFNLLTESLALPPFNTDYTTSNGEVA